MDIKCGQCKFASKSDTPICENPSSINYENEIGEEDYCEKGTLK